MHLVVPILAQLIAREAGSQVDGVIFVLADDWGFGDVGAYSKSPIARAYHDKPPVTPNLDRLASQGSLFTNFRTMVHTSGIITIITTAPHPRTPPFFKNFVARYFWLNAISPRILFVRPRVPVSLHLGSLPI